MDKSGRSPGALFEENKQDLFAPREDIALNGQVQNRISLRSDFAHVSEQSIKPADPVAVPMIVEPPGQKRDFDGAQIAYRAETVGYSLQNQHQGSDVVALGSNAFQHGAEAGREVFKLGGEFIQGIFGAFGDKGKTSPGLDDDEPSPRYRPQTPAYGAPSPSSGMA